MTTREPHSTYRLAAFATSALLRDQAGSYHEANFRTGEPHGGDATFDISEFISIAYDEGWVVEGFTWPTWKSSSEAIRLRDDPDALASATQQQPAQLVTVLVRQDRFVEGVLHHAFRGGFMHRLIRRVHELSTEGRRSPDG